MKQMKANHADITSVLSLPLPMTAAYHQLSLGIIDIHVSLKGNYLVSIISLPLTNNVNYIKLYSCFSKKSP
jgi:hypothetical protein